jgi:ABC-type transport system involved in cytochrome bd biosynthesis fused ATPase/permease subunit
VESAARKSLADPVIAQFKRGYDQMLGRRFEDGVELSAGQWQKVALGRAYMRDAQVLILDEPTASLDARAEYEVFLRFADLTRGRMAVLISHPASRRFAWPTAFWFWLAAELVEQGSSSATGQARRPIRGAVRIAGRGLSLASACDCNAR